jgi:alkyl hydroperoxide reductase subunit AhpF
MADILDESVKKQLAGVFMALDEPVELIYFGSQVENCEYCEPMVKMLEEVSGLSDRIHLTQYDLDDNPHEADRFGIDKAPTVTVAGRIGDGVRDYGIRFAGIPAGHEFATLIRDILMVSKRDSGLATETRRFLAQLHSPVHLAVFSTPT